MDENLIQYGVVLYVIEHDFAIRPCDVQGLLDRFRWNVRKDTGVKDHIYRLLVSALRIINHFTKAVTEAGANATAAMLPPSTAGAAAFNESSAVRADAAIPSDNEPLNELEAAYVEQTRASMTLSIY